MAIIIRMPALSDAMAEATLARWTVAIGDRVARGDVIAEVESDKAVMEVASIDSGVVDALLVAEGAGGIRADTPIARLSTVQGKADETAATPGSPTQGQRTAGARVLASPLARRVAAARGVDLAQVIGTGPGGRVIMADVPSETAPEATGDEPPEQGTNFVPPETPLRSGPQPIRDRSSETWLTTPPICLRVDVNLERLAAVRAEINRQAASRDVHLSLIDFIVRASALALQQTPACNVVSAGDSFARLETSDIAVAMDIGVCRQVVRNAERKSLAVLSAELKDLETQAQSLEAGTSETANTALLIANFGQFGIDGVFAALSPPHAMALGIGAATRRPVVVDEAIAVATCATLTLSFDHRAIDAATAAQFLTTVSGYLEAPLAMLV